MVWTFPRLCSSSTSICHKKKPTTYSSAILKAMLQKEELEPSFDDVVQIRFNSSHGRIVVQELASEQGHQVIPENNAQVRDFISTHGRARHGKVKSDAGSSLHDNGVASAHGRVESPRRNYRIPIVAPQSLTPATLQDLKDFSAKELSTPIPTLTHSATPTTSSGYLPVSLTSPSEESTEEKKTEPTITPRRSMGSKAFSSWV